MRANVWRLLWPALSDVAMAVRGFGTGPETLGNTCSPTWAWCGLCGWQDEDAQPVPVLWTANKMWMLASWDSPAALTAARRLPGQKAATGGSIGKVGSSDDGWLPGLLSLEGLRLGGGSAELGFSDFRILAAAMVLPWLYMMDHIWPTQRWLRGGQAVLMKPAFTPKPVNKLARSDTGDAAMSPFYFWLLERSLGKLGCPGCLLLWGQLDCSLQPFSDTWPVATGENTGRMGSTELAGGWPAARTAEFGRKAVHFLE